MTNTDTDWDCRIEALYEAVGKESAIAAALGGFREAFGASGVLYLSPPTLPTDTSIHFAACDIDPTSLAEYHSHYFAHDEWVKAAWRRGGLFEPGFACVGSQLVPRRELIKTYYWRDFLSRYGIDDALSGTVEGSSSPDTQPTFVSFYRTGGNGGNFPVEMIDRLKRLLPHLRRSLRMHRRLAPELSIGSTLKDLFDTLDLPMCYLKRDGQLVEANESAQRMLNRKAHLQTDSAGLLKMRSDVGWNSVATALSELESLPSVSIALTDAQGTPASLSMRRVHGVLTDRFSTNMAFAVATLRPVPVTDAQSMTGRFGFSPTETKVAQLLLNGKSPKEIAANLQVAMPTVRTHLSRLYEKTGTHRQNQLIARIQSG